MLIENPYSRAVPSERHNRSERSDDAVQVWRVTGHNETSLRFCCRLGRLSVYEEPSERHILTVNVGRVAEIRRRAVLRVESIKRGLPAIRSLTSEEKLACWSAAVADPETRFFESLTGGPERLGGRGPTLRTLTAILKATGHPVPWPEGAELS